VGDGAAARIGDQHAIAAALDRPFVGRVALEQPAHDAGAAGIREELPVITDEATRRHMEDETGLAAAGRAHVHELAAALADLLDHDARELVVDVDLHLLNRLLALAGSGICPEDDARAADRELVAFAPHRLHQHGELQLAAAGHLERVLALGLAHANGDIALSLALQARAA